MCRSWDNVGKYGRDRQATGDNIWHRKDMICMPDNQGNNTVTHSEYLMLIAFSTATMVTWMRLNVTLYTHCLSCCIIWTKCCIYIIYEELFLTCIIQDIYLQGVTKNRKIFQFQTLNMFCAWWQFFFSQECAAWETIQCVNFF